MKKQRVRLGVVCFARKSFDFEAALEIYQNIQKDIKRIDEVDYEIIPDLVIEIKDAQDAANKLASSQVDAVVCISGTFHLGNLILEINKIVQKPILLWGLYELPYNGGKIRLNSVCGVNLDSSNLYKAGIKDFHYIIGDSIDEDWIDAIRLTKAFRTAKLGIVGYRAQGFFNLDVDELILYKETGILIEHYELQEIFNESVEDSDVQKRKTQIASIFDLSGITESQTIKVAELTVKLEEFLNKHEITALAIRCWPEFAAEFGISPCAAMSILQSEDRILACEGDVLGAVSMYAHRVIGGETPFLADFSQVDFKDEFALLWHCGVAPCNLWDGKCNRSLDTYFAGGKGVTADFVMKPGKISIVRIDETGSEFRILLQSAKGVPMEKDLKGTYLKAKFNEPISNVLDKIISNGIAHHVSVVYGEYFRPFEIFAKIKGWRLIK